MSAETGGPIAWYRHLRYSRRSTARPQRTELWNASSDAVKNALAPREATIVTGKQVTRYDLALMGYGQGYAGQMTPLQMALAAAAIANMEGKLMKPKIEFDRPPEMFKQVIPPRTAQREREIMGLVTGGSQRNCARRFRSSEGRRH